MKNTDPKYLILVDAYLSGKTITQIAFERGIACVHVKSSPHLPGHFLKNFDDSCFEAEFSFENQINEIVSFCKDKNVIGVLPGVETGVGPANILATELGLPTNDPKTLNMRTNKFDMAAQLASAGLGEIKQLKVNLPLTDKTPIHGLLSEHKTLVIKPEKGAGGVDVKFCSAIEEVDNAITDIQNNQNVLGHQNQAVVIQTRLIGKEYAVNSLSWQGKVYVTDIWEYTKRVVPGHGSVFDRSVLLQPSDPIHRQLSEYIAKALPKLGQDNGPSHSEVIISENGVPSLIDFGSRFQGSINKEVWSNYLPNHQIQLMLDLFEGKSVTLSETESEHCLHWCDIILNEDTKFDNVSSLQKQLSDIEYIKEVHLHIPENGLAKKTTNLTNSVGDFFIVAPNKGEVQTAYDKFYQALLTKS